MRIQLRINPRFKWWQLNLEKSGRRNFDFSERQILREAYLRSFNSLWLPIFRRKIIEGTHHILVYEIPLLTTSSGYNIYDFI